MYENKLWNTFYIHFFEYVLLIPFYNYIVNQLVNINILENPNILLYGAKGFPHNLLIETAIAKKFNLKLPIKKRYPVWNNLFSYIETDYYFEIDCRHPEFPSDLTVILDFLLTISKHKCMHLDRHIIIIKNIDFFHHNNSQSIRVIFERFYNNSLFICTTNSINKIEAPIQSRMQLYRVPLPSQREQSIILEKLTGNKDFIYIDRNFVKNVFFNEHTIQEITIFPAIKEFVTSCKNKEDIRKFSLKLFQQNISIKELILDLLNHIHKNKIYDFLEQCTAIEYQSMHLDSSKICFYLELILLIFYRYKEES
jgi:DNA polymerase III delta prime subunit